MNIFVYSDESGVFDKVHNRFYVFGGVIFLDKESKDDCTRMYIKAERDIKRKNGMGSADEVKASTISNAQKGKLFRALNRQIRFGVVVDEHKVLEQIWKTKKDKQRYLDYVYKIAVKRCFEYLIRTGRIDPTSVQNIYFHVDEHSTATNGRYELQESLEQEFKHGTYNMTWSRHFPPLFPNLCAVSVNFCNSGTTTLVRAADIVANHIYHQVQVDEAFCSCTENLFVIRQP